MDIIVKCVCSAVGGLALLFTTAGAISLAEDDKKIKRQAAAKTHKTKDEYLPKEFDSTERNAEVYLYTYPPEELSGLTDVGYHHWAIIVLFEDGACRVLEGNVGEDGNLYGQYKKHPGSKPLSQVKLGDVRCTSPQSLRECVNNNELNGTRYNLTWNNCQEWALKAAETLGKHILKKLQEVERVPSLLAVPIAMYHSLTSNVPVASKSSNFKSSNSKSVM